jgi:DNA gyrase/topoisomerase IV subunit A
MNLDSLSDKNLQEVERLAKELLMVLRKSKLMDEPIYAELQALEQEAGSLRRSRFDATDNVTRGY